MEIIYKDKNVVAVNKPVFMPTQRDLTADTDAMTLLGQMLESYGEGSDLWLVHRLDRVVGGVLVFARNKKTAAELSVAFAERRTVKEYFAVSQKDLGCGVMKDFLYKDAGKGKSYVVGNMRGGVKEAKLEYSTLCTACGVSLVRVRLHTGRFHQIRAQFSSRGGALIGDGKYGSKDNRAHSPALFCTKVSFALYGKSYDISVLPDIDLYPWSLFDREEYLKS